MICEGCGKDRYDNQILSCDECQGMICEYCLYMCDICETINCYDCIVSMKNNEIYDFLCNECSNDIKTVSTDAS